MSRAQSDLVIKHHKETGHYAVYRDGVRVSGWIGSYDQALTRADNIRARSELRERKCMTCERVFMSEGSHNRMCQYCKLHKADPFNGDYGTGRPSLKGA